MGKLIAKTAAIALSALIALSVIVLSLIALFAPSKMADITARLKLYSVSAFFQQTAYERSGDINDLYVLVELSVYAKNDSYVVKYGQLLLNDERFGRLCELKDDNVSVYTLGTYRDYISGNYAVSLYRTGKKDEAFEAVEYTVKESYLKNNGMIYLMREAVKNGDKPFISEIIDCLRSLYYYFEIETNFSETEQAKDVTLDIAILYGELGDTELYVEWLERFLSLKD